MASLRVLFNMPFRNVNAFSPSSALRLCSKNFSVITPLMKAYDPDGKTVVSILNSEENAPLMIDQYGVHGFKLNLGVYVVGPIILFPRTVLSWNIAGDKDINEKTLSLFFHLSPKPDILVIGLSDSKDQKLVLETRTKIYEIMMKTGNKINIEVQPTEKATATFNFLCSEQRYVAAALIPPVNFTPTEEDQFKKEYFMKKERYGDIFVDEEEEKLVKQFLEEYKEKK